MSRIEREIRQSIPMIVDVQNRDILSTFADTLSFMAFCYWVFTTGNMEKMDAIASYFQEVIQDKINKTKTLPHQRMGAVVVAIPPSPLDHKPQAPDVSLNVVMPERRPLDAAIVRDEAGQIIGMTSAER